MTIRTTREGTENFWGEKYEKAAKNIDGSNCIACGKKTGKITQGVFIGGGGGYIVHPDDQEADMEINGAGWMGWFPVGNECIKAIPKEFRYSTTVQEDGTIS